MNLQRSRINYGKKLLEVQPSNDSQLLSSISQNKTRAQSLFITQKNIQNHLSQIQNHHTQLNQYIDSLESKVKESMEKNEGQILKAYKNHIALVKKDMEQLRKESLAQANNSNSYVETIEYLEKKLSIFRDQSLKLFNRLDQREKQMDDLKLKMEQIRKENEYMSESVKLLTKRNKELEIDFSHLKRNEDKQDPEFQQYTQKYDISMLNKESYRNKFYQRKNKTTLTSANASKNLSLKNQNTILAKQFLSTEKQDTARDSKSELFTRQLRLKLSYIESSVLGEIVRVAEETYNELQKKNMSRFQTFERGKTRLEHATRVTMRSKSNYTTDYPQNNRPASSSMYRGFKRQDQNIQRDSSKFNAQQQMSNYFVKCVDTIKKQIMRKKDLSSINFYGSGNPISFEQFSRLDCIKLMQLALSNKNVLEGLYELLLEQKD